MKIPIEQKIYLCRHQFLKMRYRLSFLTVFFYLLHLALFAQNLKPYLQSPTDHSIWVGWRTVAGTESIVRWGLAPDALTNTVNGAYHPFAANNLWHSAKLTGLQPNTHYYYKVITGTEASGVSRFRTYQSPGTAHGHIRVLIVGDTQHPITAQRTFAAAKAKLIEKYGPDLEDQVQLILKQGDNVDAGVLSQYSTMHFDPLNILSAHIPTMTVLGNHEYYQNSDLSLYFPHFEFDDPDLQYHGIAGQNGEHYYAFRVGPVLFCMLNSNEWWSTQSNWLDSIVTTANTDPTVKWVFGTAHHPLRCENWISDGSAYIRDQVLPILRTSEKTAMYTSGHSHMYARGSSRDSAVWEMISGGGGLIQNWNQNPEEDYADVQRSFDVWTYQIMDIDLDAGTMDVDCYSIGNNDYVLDNVLIDKFHRYFGKQQPARPSITAPADSVIMLPYTFSGSNFVSTEGELYNSTEFEMADPSGDFENHTILRVKRDYEDFFQIESKDYFSPVDQMAGVDIFKLTVDSTQVFAGGKNWLRVRYRDRNLEWSDWSDPVAFIAQNGKTLALDPIAWWHFDGDAHDATEHGHDGVVPATGVTFEQDEPVRGQVAVFNNTQGIPVRTGTDASLGLPVTQMTVSGWVKVNAADTWGGFIGCLQDNGTYERGWVLGTREQKFSFALVSSNTNAMTYLIDNQNFNLGKWYYITATYNGSVMKLFVNGILKASSNEQSGDIIYAGYPSDWFGIGSYVDENENWLHDGALDELILWERALPDAEVADFYAAASNMAPHITIVAPLANSTYIAPASMTVTAEASDVDGTLGVVEFYDGTQKIYEDTDGAPFTFVWENVPAGIHTLTAKASDNLGAKTASAPVEVIVLVNMPPVVSLVSPLNNSVFTAPAQIGLAAEASDSDGSIASIAFFAGINKIGEDIDGPPFTFNWDNVNAGMYELTVRATDNNGAQTASLLVSITVSPEVGTNVPGQIRPIALAPNPTNGVFRILTEENLTEAYLTIYNAENQTVLTRQLDSKEVSLEGFPAGTYFLEIKTARGERLRGSVVKL